jgi:tetratricopeptide (TPR) repeat protein
MTFRLILCLSFAFSLFASAQDEEAPQLKSIDEVLQGIDSLLNDMDEKDGRNQAFTAESFEPGGSNLLAPNNEIDRSFRVGNELMPENLLNNDSQATPPSLDPVNEDDLGDIPQSDSNFLSPLIPDALPDPTASPMNSVESLPKLDYTQATLEDLLREVDLLEMPEFQMPLRDPIEPPVSPLQAISSERPREVMDQGDFVNTPILSTPAPTVEIPDREIDPYVVLGDQIDEELKEKIREAIMQTRMASGGSDNPYVTRSVHRATTYCNRVLGRLNAPHHKRYRRDILLSLLSMHEKNQQWVDAAKSYERFLEEFASDDSYPFEEHEDAPGIPDLYAHVGGSMEKWIESKKRGAPSIPETHIRLGKVYRNLGAYRMALNKFYDSINATLTLPKSDAFELAERRKGRSLERRRDAESNRAMYEIAETFMDSEDYDNAIKFFDRLRRLEDLEDTDRAVVRFKQGLAHYRRASENLRKQESLNRLSPEEKMEKELDYDRTPRADFAKVKETLKGYGTLFPQSPYVPESHYLLALTYEQLNQDEESIAELLLLLKEADFNPDLIADLETGNAMRDRDLLTISKMKAIWAFWKKKTGNYLANKFFEESEFFNAYRIYSALRDIDQSPSWQIPVLYQIALCQEKLGNYVQAMESYSAIEEFVNSEGAREGLADSKYLEFVFGMAKWRREQLEDTRAIRQAVNRYGIYTLPSTQAN